MPGDAVEVIWDRRISIGATTPEPSIRELLYGYYRGHFDHGRAVGLTDAYIAALAHSAAPVPQEVEVLCARLETPEYTTLAICTEAAALLRQQAATIARLREALENSEVSLKEAYYAGGDGRDGRRWQIVKEAREGMRTALSHITQAQEGE